MKTQFKGEKSLKNPKKQRAKYLRSWQVVGEIEENNEGRSQGLAEDKTGSSQAQQYQRIPLSPFSHPASILFMMFCYYWQGEVCILYPASLAGPCFLCFQNGSPHPLFENQCYQEISKKKMVVAF